MPRNQFKDEDETYKCPRCCLDMCALCNDLLCGCEHHKTPAGKPEDEEPNQDDEPEYAVAEGMPRATFAELRKSHQLVTEAHRKTGHI